MTTKLLCPLALISLVLLMVGSASAIDGASVIDARHWEWDWCPTGCDFSVIDRCLGAKLYWDDVYSSPNVRLRQVSTIYDSVAQFSVYGWVDELNDAWDADILTHGSAFGHMVAEYYGVLRWREKRLGELYDQGWSEDEVEGLEVTQGSSTAFVVAFTRYGISNRLANTKEDAIVEANYCYSCLTHDDWQLDSYSGAFLCFDSAASGVYACPDLDKVMQVLGCSSGLGDVLPEAGVAASLAGETEIHGYELARYSWEKDCRNPAARFDRACAFDDRVAFSTSFEAGSILFFVMGVDSWSDVGSRKWTDWDVLARVTPAGGRDVTKFYEVSDIPKRAVYRVVEVDPYGRP